MKKRILGLLLSIVLCLSLMPTVVWAGDEPEGYNVWVNGEEFTSENRTITCGDGTASYDPDTATLTLDGATITQIHKASDRGNAIYAKQPLTVNVTGKSTISLGEDATGAGIYTIGNLTITGDGALNISTENERVNAVWVAGRGDLMVNMNGDLTVTSACTALSAEGNVTLAGNGSSTINAGEYADGIYSTFKDIALSGSGNVTINAGYGIDSQNGNTVIDGSGDIVIDAKKEGFRVLRDLTVGGSGKLTVNAESNGLLCNNVIFTGERTADITAGEDGIVPSGETELGGSGDITIIAKEYGINVYYNGDVKISGSGKLTINAGYKGIVSYSGAILSGSGEVEIYGKENAVYFDNEQGAVRLNGTGSPITLSADEGKKAVYNITTNQCPIEGTASDDYGCVAGAPDTASVVYRLEHSYGEWTTAKEPTLTEKGMKERSCTACGDKQTEELPVLTPASYTIISGANGEWTKGNTEGLSVTSNAPFSKFDSVKVDGATIAESNYSAVEGSTKVTLNAAYLETLSVGSHSIDVVSTDGMASTSFTVNAATPADPANPTDPASPRTGDNSHIFLWIALLFISGGVLAGTTVYGRKKKHNAD